MSVFLDANILFSASAEQSNIARFLHWLHSRKKLVTSHYAAMEAERNIIVKRPQWQEGYQTMIERLTIVPEAALTLNVKLTDKDKPILGAAVAAQCSFLITGDKKDFGHLYWQTVGGVTVVSYLAFAEMMLKKQ